MAWQDGRHGGDHALNRPAHDYRVFQAVNYLGAIIVLYIAAEL